MPNKEEIQVEQVLMERSMKIQTTTYSGIEFVKHKIKEE